MKFLYIKHINLTGFFQTTLLDVMSETSHIKTENLGYLEDSSLRWKFSHLSSLLKIKDPVIDKNTPTLSYYLVVVHQNQTFFQMFN